MRIIIVTIIDNENIGSYLQAFAISKAVEEMGHDPKLLDYCRPSRSFGFLLKKSISCKKIWRWPLLWIGLLLRQRTINRQRPFIKAYLTEKHYIGYQDVLNNPPMADIYVTGSDQVWNSFYNHGVDFTYYLAFAPKGAKRISYASSIGMDVIPKSEKSIMNELLEQYSSISVREMSAKSLLTSIGLDKERITVDLDPTFLLDKMKWAENASPVLVDSPYLLVYSVEHDNDNEINDVVRFIAEKKNLKIVLMTIERKHKKIKCDMRFSQANPNTFISLFLHASFVVVSSFHGTAFSVNFQKDFVTVVPNRFSTRIDSLLDLCGLQNRKYSRLSRDLTDFLTPIDYKKVTPLLEAERKKSLYTLSSYLNC